MEQPPTPPPMTTARAVDLTVSPRSAGGSLGDRGRFELEPGAVGAEAVAGELDRCPIGRIRDPLDEQQRGVAPDAERARVGVSRLDELEPLDGPHRPQAEPLSHQVVE